jgi:hypothetical protein
MRKFIFVLVLAASLLAGCAGSGKENVANSNPAANASQTNVTVIDTNSAASAPAANTNPPVNMVGNTTMVNGIPANAPVQKIEVKQTGKPVLLTNPAAYDSEVSTIMNAQGQPIEIRIFKKHATVAKIERIHIVPNKDVRIKIYTKNGKVYEVEDAKLPDVLKISPDDIAKVIPSASPSTPTTDIPSLSSLSGSGPNTTAPAQGQKPLKQPTGQKQGITKP